MKGYYVQRMNSGMIQATNRYGGKHMVRMAKVGTPDIMAFKMRELWFSDDSPLHKHMAREILFIEVKRPGKKPTELQQVKMEELEEYGARCIVATCIEDVEKAIGSDAR